MSDRSSPSGTAGTLPSDTQPESWFDRLRARIGWKNGPSIREDLADALAASEVVDFSPQERAMLRNVLKLRGMRVDDVMVPRADIVAVPAESSLGDLLRVFRTAGHSRLPVYGETLDDPRGMVHIRDFLDFIAASAERSRSPRRRKSASQPSAAPSDAAGPHLAGVDLSQSLASARILRNVLYVPPSMPAVDLLARMQATRTHMALVIDEYGGTDGLVSIEDLVEMVVGDIEDEHDDAEGPGITPLDERTFAADARASLEEATQVLGVDLLADINAEEVDTLGGLVTNLAGRVPARGELISGPHHLEFEILDADARRVKRLRIHRRQHGEAAAPETPVPASASQPLPSMREGEARAARDEADAARAAREPDAPVPPPGDAPAPSQRDSAA